MMGWVFVYPLFMVVAAAFTITAELAFGRDNKVKYIGINVGIILLLLIFAQRFFPMEQFELGLKDNYLGHVKVDVQDLTPNDKAVRVNGVSIVARNLQEDQNGFQDNTETSIGVYKDGKVLDEITVSEAAEKIQKIIPPEKQGEFNGVDFREVRYVGFRKKGGTLDLTFNKGYVTFKYQLIANEQGFIWESERYKAAGITLPKMEGLYGDETNKKIKDIILKGDKEQIICVEITIEGDEDDALKDMEALGHKIISQKPVVVEIPFYEIANLSHLEYVQHFEIK
jgi:hypothetical protein